MHDSALGRIGRIGGQTPCPFVLCLAKVARTGTGPLFLRSILDEYRPLRSAPNPRGNNPLVGAVRKKRPRKDSGRSEDEIGRASCRESGIGGQTACPFNAKSLCVLETLR